MRLALLSVAIALIAPSVAATTAKGEGVPFIGYPADGQTGPIEPPRGEPKVVALGTAAAEGIAYYKGEQSPGVYAPRGWYCQVWYGSGGSTVVVTPIPTGAALFPPPAIKSPAVELQVLFGGTSGRFRVATYASRLFPTLAATFIDRVRAEGLVPASQFGRGPYSNDSVRDVASGVAEFTTPANTRGLGTEGNLHPTQDAVRGVAVLDPSDDWTMSILRVRLGPVAHALESTVLRLNQQCMRGAAGC